ncbi:hypothetical protein K9K77_02950 [Candidatus Babeliales bacterium]|nr:hypothetical protein [Candidatus Babeliales bacterium]
MNKKIINVCGLFFIINSIISAEYTLTYEQCLRIHGYPVENYNFDNSDNFNNVDNFYNDSSCSSDSYLERNFSDSDFSKESVPYDSSRDECLNSSVSEDDFVDLDLAEYLERQQEREEIQRQDIYKTLMPKEQESLEEILQRYQSWGYDLLPQKSQQCVGEIDLDAYGFRLVQGVSRKGERGFSSHNKKAFRRDYKRKKEKRAAKSTKYKKDYKKAAFIKKVVDGDTIAREAELQWNEYKQEKENIRFQEEEEFNNLQYLSNDVNYLPNSVDYFTQEELAMYLEDESDLEEEINLWNDYVRFLNDGSDYEEDIIS